jgi:anaerobic ribonucleoside-triphosphate reductase activating protein
MLSPRSLKIHHMLKASRANGPGLRAVVWMQGCSLGCPGCFNPDTHDFKTGERIDVERLAISLLELPPEIEGITISGGEPFQQTPALADLLASIRRSSTLSVVVFTGYTLEELNTIPSAPTVFPSIDLLIAGRYEQTNRVAAGLLGSSNKKLHFLTQRYTAADMASVPDAEILINPDGSIVLSGIHPVNWHPKVRERG